jgi:hypothetical protein
VVKDVFGPKSHLLNDEQAGILTELVQEAHQKNANLFVHIFRQFEKTESGNHAYAPLADSYRQQISLKNLLQFCNGENQKLFDSIQSLVEKIESWCRKHNAEYTVDPDSIQFLLSFPGGQSQMLHTDYTVDNAIQFQNIGIQHPPLFVICPLSGDAQLRIAEGKPGKVVESERGANSFYWNPESEHNVHSIRVPHTDALIMHGYAAHGGCAYKEINVRMHFYILQKKALDATKAHGSDNHICKNTGTLFESKFEKELME